MFERAPKPHEEGTEAVGEGHPFNRQLQEELKKVFPEAVEPLEEEDRGAELVIDTSGPKARAFTTEFEAMQAAADAWDDEVVDMDVEAARPATRKLSVVSAEPTTGLADAEQSPLESELQELEEEPVDVVSNRIVGRIHALHEKAELVAKEKPSFTIEAGPLGVSITELSHESMDALQAAVSEHFEQTRSYRGIPGTIRIDVERAHDAIEQEITAIQTSLAGNWDAVEMSKNIRNLNEAIASFASAKEVLERYRASVAEESLTQVSAPASEAAEEETIDESVTEAYKLRDSYLEKLQAHEAAVAGGLSIVAEGRVADEDRRRFTALAQKFKNTVERPFVEMSADTESIAYTDAEKLQLHAMAEELDALRRTIERREGIVEKSEPDVLILDTPVAKDEVAEELKSFDIPSPEELKNEYLPQVEALRDALERTRSRVDEARYAARERVDFKDGVTRLETLLSELNEDTLSLERVNEVRSLFHSLQELHGTIMREEARTTKNAEVPVAQERVLETIETNSETLRSFKEDVETLDIQLARSKTEKKVTEATAERAVYAQARTALIDKIKEFEGIETLAPEQTIQLEQLYRELHTAFKEVAKHEEGSMLQKQVLEDEKNELIPTFEQASSVSPEHMQGETELDEVVPDTFAVRPQSKTLDDSPVVSEDVPGLEAMPHFSEQADAIYDEILAKLPGGGVESKIWKGGWITRGIKDMRVQDFLTTRPTQDVVRMWLDTLVDEAYPHVPKIENNMSVEEFVHKLSYGIARARNQENMLISSSAIARERDV